MINEEKLRMCLSQALFAGYANGSLDSIKFLKEVHDVWLDENMDKIIKMCVDNESEQTTLG